MPWGLKLNFQDLAKRAAFGIILMTVAGYIVITYYGVQITSIYITIILAFIASDVLSGLFVKGGNGILQIPLFGPEAQAKGYGFLAFFISILATAWVSDQVSGWVIVNVLNKLSDPRAALGTSFVLAILVYLDMNAKYYSHS